MRFYGFLKNRRNHHLCNLFFLLRNYILFFSRLIHYFSWVCITYNNQQLLILSYQLGHYYDLHFHSHQNISFIGEHNTSRRNLKIHSLIIKSCHQRFCHTLNQAFYINRFWSSVRTGIRNSIGKIPHIKLKTITFPTPIQIHIKKSSINSLNSNKRNRFHRKILHTSPIIFVIITVRNNSTATLLSIIRPKRNKSHQASAFLLNWYVFDRMSYWNLEISVVIVNQRSRKYFLWVQIFLQIDFV